MARHAHDVTGERHAVLAGGVALNSVANGRLLREGPFDELWIQPAAGDAGSAIGCALWAWHDVLGNPRSTDGRGDAMGGAYLGPSFDPDEIASDLVAAGRPFTRVRDPHERAARIAELVDEGNVVGLFQGRMEFGPRALGHRSIIADPRSPEMQRVLNEKIKHRESFRPFAPAVLADHASEWFELDAESPYMLLVAPVRADRLVEVAGGPDDRLDVFERVHQVRSAIPAVTHVDGSARIQTVDERRSPAFHRILAAFHERTGCPVLVNTSFNVRGEPIVCTPDEAYRCFVTTDMDWLVLEDCILDRRDQPPWTGPAAPIELD
jgi:carbamoyltransferase